MAEVIKNGYGFMVLFDVENRSPDGGPNAGDLPRIDPESGCGITTDVCLKRKIRNYVETLKGDEPGYRICVREDIPLNRGDNTVYTKLKTDEKGIKELKKKGPQADQEIRGLMYRGFFGIRAFSAIMTTFVKTALDCGQMRGPAQLGFARSVNPIVSQKITITRVAITTEKDVENKSTEMGRKNIIPYALYRAEGYISASLTKKSTGFSGGDLELLQDAIINMLEIDHSAARGKITVHRLIVSKHSRELGDCLTYKLFDAVEVKKNEEVEYPREYGDYTVAVHRDQIPETVGVSEKI